jgi:diadenylate cyclase
MSQRPGPKVLDVLRRVAPGTPLREGLDRILQGNKGALIVVADGPDVLNICSGGFLLDAAYSPQRLSELAKMDGAIISETGTRHRTAERVARNIHAPVVSVSEAMSTITVYVGDEKHVLEAPTDIIFRVNQALRTLERYRYRLDEVRAALSSLEVEDLVTLRDMVAVLQRTEMVRRIAAEIEVDIIELGVEGRLVQLQLLELMAGVEDDRRLLIKDYFHEEASWHLEESLAALDALDSSFLLDLSKVAAVLHIPEAALDLDMAATSRGYRMLAQIPRLPEGIIERVIAHFGALPEIIRASIEDLEEVEGVGAARAHAIKEGLSRLTETSILGRYV